MLSLYALSDMGERVDGVYHVERVTVKSTVGDRVVAEVVARDGEVVVVRVAPGVAIETREA